MTLYGAMAAQYAAERRAGASQKDALYVLQGTLAEFKMNIKRAEKDERRSAAQPPLQE
jgi:hypothetical protein